MPIFRFPRDDQQIDGFMRWLREQENRGVLQVISENENTFVRASYNRGLEHASRLLQEQGVDVQASDLQAVLNTPVHSDALQFLYTRNFNELQGITEVMNQQISRELAEGFSQGQNPRVVARAITDRVEKIGITRANVLAQTEIIRAHSEATLNRYERLGVGNVTIQAEWSTAGDDRVCPICEALEGQVFTIEEARSGSFSFDGSQFAIRPPAHPRCRCVFLPVLVD